MANCDWFALEAGCDWSIVQILRESFSKISNHTAMEAKRRQCCKFAFELPRIFSQSLLCKVNFADEINRNCLIKYNKDKWRRKCSVQPLLYVNIVIWVSAICVFVGESTEIILIKVHIKRNRLMIVRYAVL